MLYPCIECESNHTIGYGDIAFKFFLGYRKCRHKCSLGVNLVIDNFIYVASDTSPLYQILKQLDNYLWRYCILNIWGIQSVVWLHTTFVLVLGEYQISIATYLRGGGYLPSYKILNRYVEFFSIRESTTSGSTGGRGGDAKTIISPNTSFGDTHIHIDIQL